MLYHVGCFCKFGWRVVIFGSSELPWSFAVFWLRQVLLISACKLACHNFKAAATLKRLPICSELHCHRLTQSAQNLGIWIIVSSYRNGYPIGYSLFIHMIFKEIIGILVSNRIQQMSVSIYHLICSQIPGKFLFCHWQHVLQWTYIMIRSAALLEMHCVEPFTFIFDDLSLFERFCLLLNIYNGILLQVSICHFSIKFKKMNL